MDKPANFRDLGGIVNKNGQKIKPKRLLRSGELTGLTAGESRILSDDYHVKTIIDFRSSPEAGESPDMAIKGAHYHNIDILKNAEEHVSSFGNFHSIKDKSQVLSFMNEVYELMIEDETATKGFASFLNIVLDEGNDGAVLYHCFAGKDRTGLATAILLTILDVEREVIFDDYLLTNEMRRDVNKVLLQQDRERGLSEDHLEIIGNFLLVEREYLETSFDTAEKKYGSFDNYITEALGLSDSGRRTLKDRYLE